MPGDKPQAGEPDGQNREVLNPSVTIPSESGNKAERVHEDDNQVHLDLQDFYTKREKVTEQQKDELLAKIDDVTKGLRPGSVEYMNAIHELRKAFLNQQEMEADGMKRFATLGGVFLDQDPSAPKNVYSINFHEKGFVDKHIGLGDMFPPEVEEVSVVNSEGVIISSGAIRAVNSAKRIGYFDKKSGLYVPVHEGDRVVILKTRTPGADQKDPVLLRRKFMESSIVNQTPKVLGDQHYEDEDKQGGVGEAAGKKRLDHQGNDEGNRDALTRSGSFKAIRGRVPVKVREMAEFHLKQARKLGDSWVEEIDGKRYSFTAETHYHPNGYMGRNWGVNGWHMGITARIEV